VDRAHCVEQKLLDVVDNHDPSTPLFLYYAFARSQIQGVQVEKRKRMRKLSKGQRLLGASIIYVAGQGLTHRQLCNSSQAKRWQGEQSRGHPPTTTRHPSLLLSCYYILLLLSMLAKGIKK
jgi:hypothetical protein